MNNLAGSSLHFSILIPHPIYLLSQSVFELLHWDSGLTLSQVCFSLWK